MSTPENPAGHVPPVPRYGEYAPPGQVPPLQPYGQQPPPSQPVYYQQPQGPRPARTWDLVLSIVLLVIGFFSVLVAVLNALTLNVQMDALYEQYGADGSYEPTSGTVIAQAVIIVSHVVLYIVAVAVTILLLRRRKVAFWLPLTLGVIASIIFIVTFVVVIIADPNLYQVLLEQSAP